VNSGRVGSACLEGTAPRCCGAGLSEVVRFRARPGIGIRLWHVRQRIFLASLSFTVRSLWHLGQANLNIWTFLRLDASKPSLLFEDVLIFARPGTSRSHRASARPGPASHASPGLYGRHSQPVFDGTENAT